eukprot:GSMAST32.ASY1.ANO1.137.1 assembled CDS
MSESYYNKRTLLLKTPLVLLLAKTQFGCNEIEGVPLEDLPLGKNSHWEARLFGPAVMSYGGGTGEPYLSDITLAFLEDTRQYALLQALQQQLLQALKNQRIPTPLNLMSKTITDLSLASVRTPGFLRWGRGEGCRFLRGSAGAWSDKYACKASKPNEGGCTPDNRMSARCNLVQYGPTSDHKASKQAGCNGESSSVKCWENANYPYLPNIYTYFGTEDGSKLSGTGGILGGFSPAMDHAPVRVGYWSCLDDKPSSTRSKIQDFSGVFNTLSTDLQLFGGQSHCKNCRCFESSSLKFDPSMSKYGLCYAMNCYSPTYLQFKIRGRLNSSWYKCPAGGGNVHLPGFSGSITCMF